MKASHSNPSAFKWSDALPKVMFNLNTDYHSSIRTTAFKAVYGMDHNTGSKKAITNIEENSLTLDSYDRLIKRSSFTIDSFDRVVRRGDAEEDDEGNASMNDIDDLNLNEETVSYEQWRLKRWLMLDSKLLMELIGTSREAPR